MIKGFNNTLGGMLAFLPICLNRLKEIRVAADPGSTRASTGDPSMSTLA